MKNLNTIEYYKGNIYIPNLDKDSADFTTVYMPKYQKKYLIKVLGYSMYKDFETELAKEEVDIPQIWKDLRDGVDYEVEINGETTLTMWNGFVNTEKVSPISDFTFYYYLRQNNEQLTDTGVGSSNKENATSKSPSLKLKDAWNEQILLTGNIKDYIYRTHYNYKEDKYYREDLNFIDDSVKLDESLFMYLYAHRDDFANWVFTNDIKINQLGI